MSIDDFIQNKLAERERSQLIRSLRTPNGLVDFCSNDYLGLARSEELQALVAQEWESHQYKALGSGGSRLLAGNSAYAEELEASIATFHGAEAGLIYNSGYDANVGLFSAILQPGNTIISDELVHASIIDGIRLSKANRLIFKHNNLVDLEQQLKQSSGTIFIAIESVYSMDGDEAPLQDIHALAQKYQAHIIIDEAHATGILGAQGRGMVHALGLEKEVFARVHTFGKALGTHGAIVLGSADLRRYLINFSRSFIYSTALPLHSLISIKSAYDILSKSNHNILIINNLIKLFKYSIEDKNIPGLLPSNTPIQSLIVPGNAACRALATKLQAAGLDARPILSPTVPAGMERIRICLHTYNTEAEIAALCKALQHEFIQP